jgi:hypothetical protein
MHNDFHYGNVLVDTDIDPKDKSTTQYVLHEKDNENPLIFNVPNTGIFCKIWDLEYSKTFKSYNSFDVCNNKFFIGDEEEVPNYFNPYYDVHYFLTSLLELPIPDKLRSFIHSFYPDELIPIPRKFYNNDDDDDDEDLDDAFSDCSLGSQCSRCGELFADSDSDIDSTSSYNDYYYKTDEETDDEDDNNSSNEYDSDGESICECEKCIEKYKKILNLPDDYIFRKDNDENDENESVSASSSISLQKHRTEFMFGGKLLNGVEKKFKLPTPIDILKHSYFDEYRKPAKNVTLKFNFTMS